MVNARMKPLDAAWLAMESVDTPMHVGVLATFEKPPGAPADYLHQLAAQMREAPELVAPWNYRLARNYERSVSPRLVVERDFDIDYHFRYLALPAEGGERELGMMVSRLHSHALDTSKPLWEFYLIEGLERDRFAFYVKVHHALVDSVNGLPMLMSMLSAQPDQREMPPLWSRPLNSGNHGGEIASSGFPGQMPSIMDMGKAASGLVLAVLNSRAKSGTGGAPYSTLNRRINAQRRFATQQVELQRMEQLADAADCSLIELLIYLCGSSLRRFFKEYNALPDASLIGLMPLSVQERGEGVSANVIAGDRIVLGTDIGNPLARLAAVTTAVRSVLDERDLLPDQGRAAYLLLNAAPVYASQVPGIASLIPPLYNLRVTSTVGSGQPLYFDGSRLETIFPMSHLMQGSALNIGFVTYAGALNVGFTGARDTLPHLQRLAVYFGNAVNDLEELLITGTAASEPEARGPETLAEGGL